MYCLLSLGSPSFSFLLLPSPSFSFLLLPSPNPYNLQAKKQGQLEKKLGRKETRIIHGHCTPRSLANVRTILFFTDELQVCKAEKEEVWKSSKRRIFFQKKISKKEK